MTSTGWTLGQYQVGDLIGAGGMARVFRGYQPNLAREVAIKVIPTQASPEGSGAPGVPVARGAQGKQGKIEFLRLFESEARLIAKLAHPYIVPIHDFGVDQDWAYIVMELITHGSVRDEMTRARGASRRVNLLWILAILDQVGMALEFAHSRGVAHLDVKPGNMLLRELNMVVLSDFGVARIMADRGVAGNGAAPAGVMGTPQYMAPEQTYPNSPVDGRADIYALGVTLFECVTGRLPFLGDNNAIMLQHRDLPPPLPRSLEPSLPPAVERIILRALAKDPNARYQRAADMAIELRQTYAELAQAYAISDQPTVTQRGGPTASVPTPPESGQVAQARPGAPTIAPVISRPTFDPSVDNGRCFRCGALNPHSARFCQTCGYDRASARATADTYRGPNGRPLRCRLIFQNGPYAGRALMLHQGVTTIGRGPGIDLSLGDHSVSRLHARLSFARGVWYIEDLASANGVWINGKRVSGQRDLRNHDNVRFGHLESMFEMVS
ncbi:MAG TPA: protein kinase [Ktedonobacterales bacterium]